MKKNFLLGFLILLSLSPHSGQADILVATGSDIKLVDSSSHEISTFIDSATYSLAYDAEHEHIYFTDQGPSLKRADRDGSNIVTILSSASSSINDIALDLTNNKILWSDPNDAAIYRANLDGTGKELFVVGMSDPHGLYVSETTNTLYFTSLEGIDRVNLDDGQGQTNLFDNVMAGDTLTGVTLSGGKLYWLNTSDGAIYRSNTDGSTVTTFLSSSVASPRSIAYDSSLNKFVYVGAPSTGSVLSTVNTDGSIPTGIAFQRGYDLVANFTSGSTEQTSNIYDDTRMYFAVRDTVENTSRVFWTNITKEIVPVFDSNDISDVKAMTYSINTEKLYWIDVNGSTVKIRRADVDGTNSEDFLTIPTSDVYCLLADDVHNRLYYCDNARTILSVDLSDGNDEETLLSVDSNSTLLSSLGFYGGSVLFVQKYKPSGQSSFVYDYKTVNRTDKTVSSRLIGYISPVTSFASFSDDQLVQTAGYWVRREVLPEFDYENGDWYGSYGVHSLEFPQIVGIQHLDSKVAETPYVAYYGYTNIIRFVIPHPGSFLYGPFLTLGENEKLSALTEVVQPAEFPESSPVPTPTPTGQEDGEDLYDISGRVGGTSSDLSGTSAHLTPRTEEEAYFTAENGISSHPRSFVTTIGESNTFTFKNVPEGDYNLKIDREDLTLATDSVALSTGEILPTVVVRQRDFSEYSCKTKNKSTKAIKADRKVSAMVELALSLANDAYDSSSDQGGLLAESNTLNSLHEQVLEASQNVTKLQLLKCNNAELCTPKKTKAERKTYQSSIRALKAQTKRVIKLATKGKKRKTKLTRLNNLARQALASVKKLPIKTYSCEEEDASDNENYEVAGY